MSTRLPSSPISRLPLFLLLVALLASLQQIGCGCPPATSAERIQASVDWLADDAREGRGVGTEGLRAAEAWLAEQFEAIGIEPAGFDGYYDDFEVPIELVVNEGTSLTLDGEAVPTDGWKVASFTSAGTAAAEVVAVGYGITAEDLSHDDYDGVDVTGKIVAVRRFVPAGARFADDEPQRRFGDLRYKAFNAREHGAVGILLVDLPERAPGEEIPEEAVLPGLRVDAEGDAGLPAAVLSRDAGAVLFDGATHTARLVTDVTVHRQPARNVVGVVRAAEDGAAKEGSLLVGAHFDHLGMGGSGSLAPDVVEPHNGADDNASGTAALLEIGRTLVAHRADLQRDVWLVAFSGEESGLVGSTTLTREPPPGLDLESMVAMLNLDMVGRMQENKLSVLGAGSAEEWGEIVEPVCAELELTCQLGGDGYGPSDQTPFYAAGVPVLHLFTGTHEDYHRPSDDADKINAEGAAKVASLAAETLITLSARDQPLTYVRTEAPAPAGDMRSFGASLGTIPDYVGDERPGVLLSGTRPGSAAEKAGIVKGDLLVGLGGQEIRNIYDFVYVLRSAKPGETTTAVVLRGDERVELEITYDQSKR